MAVEFESVDGGNGISLAVRIYRPAEEARIADLALVLVHQFTVLGGCQGLLKGMATELNNRGYLVVTFDMRGAGRSSGRATLMGSSEVQDVVRVCEWAVEKIPASRIVLVGSSAGAPIAGSAVDQVKEVVGYVGLGYPFGFWASVLFGRHNKAILQSAKPKLFVMGTRDGFTSVKQLESKLKSAVGRAETRLVPGVGHFQMEAPDYDPMMANFVTEFCKSL
ncbi:hypothetical protein SELMODRAFT_410443 [Selaginella moellendorffii]|uniref:Xaa-Pro dipeptidyl-peptidase-like domain-containing protein n=1 Tax=Selaginella moellendorffii TaxID=88036 RepID=D8RES3_SELML|nr:uncharacterized protein LOC9646682 [Selaginella moellendorffii]EFJ29490.1 hypothetical protein SELMODRAFT_410443 [Selaginella moellendorffii]|eukprot:XP_002969402.1 uncharacterized protein LOC9646682 [Selaginella moellendorffii]